MDVNIFILLITFVKLIRVSDVVIIEADESAADIIDDVIYSRVSGDK